MSTTFDQMLATLLMEALRFPEQANALPSDDQVDWFCSVEP